MSDDSDEENVVRFGTPLPEYDEDKVPKKKSSYQDVSEQYALDANGKRRFHGAFTGGFSAGYGNTVSAPEGWTPTAFKSSRTERMQTQQSLRPEDFMDEEDRSEFGIAPREVRTTHDFTATKRKRQKEFNDGPIPGKPVLDSFLCPVHETAAMRILKSMGWKPGRGVGAQLTMEEKKSARKLYTCHIPAQFRSGSPTQDQAKASPTHSSSDEDDDDDNHYSEFLFEPDDFEPYVAKPKTDTFGIGYVGLSRHSVLGGISGNLKADDEWRGSHLVTTDKGKKVSIRGQAFGVGAMEEDDEDIYAKEDMSGYDFTLENPAERSKQILSSQQKQGQTIGSRTVLTGFVAASSSTLVTKVYPLPALPRDFKPGAALARKSRFSDVAESASGNVSVIRDRGLGRHDLTAQQRGVILGEQEREIKTTHDNEESSSNSSKNLSYEERIAAITGRNVNFVSDSTNIAKNTEGKDVSEKPGVFKPFAANPEKQQRYENFISIKENNGIAGDEKNDSQQTKNRLAEWEKVREKSEFEQAYKLYRPLSGLMNDRFVSAVNSEDVPIEPREKKDNCVYTSSEKMEAARLGMFGKLTKDVQQWRPDSLLCRRFNVPDPFGPGYGQETAGKKKATYSIFEYLEASVHNKSSFLKAQSGFKESEPKKPVDKSQNNSNSNAIESNSTQTSDEPSAVVDPKVIVPVKRMTVAELFIQEKEKERERELKNLAPTLEFQKQISHDSKPAEEKEVTEVIENFNKVDLYKAIFLSDSESENETEIKKPETKVNNLRDTKIDDIGSENASSKIVNPFESPPKNVERNPSPPRGIFANLNFDRLNSWQKNQTDSNDVSDVDKNIPKNADEVVRINNKNNSTDTNSLKTNEKPDVAANNDKSMEIDLQSCDVYGPKLPEKHIFKSKGERNTVPEANVTKAATVTNPSNAIEIDSSSSDSDSWVETSTVKSKKSHKSKHKKNKKSKKKKKSKSPERREHKHKSKKRHKHDDR